MYWITRIRTCIFLFLACTLLTGQAAGQEYIEDAPSKEYQIKAAFLYNFIKFVDWPEEKWPEPNEPVIIGIIGEDPFGNAIDPIKNKQVKDRKIAVKRFNGFEELKKSSGENKTKLKQEIESHSKCHLLFVCSSEKKNFEEIIESLKGSSVLTVAEKSGFLKAGGIINFIMEGKKVRFEINIAAARQARLKIRSQLLRLAKRVINKNATGENQEK